ncbi:MAG: hypothetical protein QM795_17010 [Pseudoxanthomonas sp.]
MENVLDSAWLPEAFAACACCVRESLDAAGVSLDCTPTRETEEPDAWRMP